MPIIAGCEINDSPLAPTCKRCRRLAAEQGDDLPIAWLTRDERYREKLATPDVTVADLIGDIDPIKAANQRLTYADEEVIHYGIIPRTNRGIFAINELPDLAPRIQVALLNILEERDLQIRGFPVRIPMDVVLVFSANPEDYTSRGNIITPLKDRIDSQILTHYPQSVETAMQITKQEAWTDRDHPNRDRDSGLHPLAGRADRIRRARLGAGRSIVRRLRAIDDRGDGVAAVEHGAPRGADARLDPCFRGSPIWPCSFPRSPAKWRWFTKGEQQGAEVVARKLIGEAVAKLFATKFPPIERAGVGARNERNRGFDLDDEELDDAFAGRRGRKQQQQRPQRQEEKPPSPSEPNYDAILGWFVEGNKITLSDEQPFDVYFAELKRVPKLDRDARKSTFSRERSRAGVLDGDDPRRPAPVAAPRARRPRLDHHLPGNDEVQRAADGEE